VVQNGAWEEGSDLLAEARRRRPSSGQTLIVPMGARDDEVRDAGAQTLCWAPWEPGQLLAAVKRASLMARASSSTQPIALP
jgi:hypothetical protein